ncbi:ARM repeat-containing protein [Aureobasidium namibiae CBS 147.97]|uniref:ARM repeat-containing protein n=1 Tax=Aureobasidium namibiae CBS 147.97 TaxID=1043004 RepID=A0A074WN32_9PEZI|nr:ARM repeat-containing protein [Aureobasidium namibiae CBS 147.97]KEQ71117.1 ARM repeat-containing protein [Aureobasidium namibiae CBS 147.97]
MSAAEQAIELVRRLNDPRFAAGASQISRELQEIQLSDHGWAAADAMLDHADANIKFYGALTLQIKLNKDRSTLNEQAAAELRSRLVLWFVSLRDLPPKLIIDKLCSTMATYFIQTPLPWTQTVRQVICSLYASDVVPHDMLSSYPDTSQIIGELSGLRLFMAVRFCRVLAEDVQNSSTLGPQYYHLDSIFKSNTTDSAILMTFVFNPSTRCSPEIAVEAVNCFSAWVAYSFAHWNTDPVALQLLQNLTPMAIQHLLHREQDVRDPTVEFFVNTLEYRSKFLQKNDLESLSLLVRKTIGPQCLAQRPNFLNPAIVAFSKLVTAYGKLIVKDLISERNRESSQEIIDLLQQLLTAPGYPAEDDQVILNVTEFWIEFAEQIADTVMDSPEDEITFLAVVRTDLMQAVQTYIPKLQAPPPSEMSEWDEDNVDQWQFFRDNISDFFDQVNAIPDTHLLSNMVVLATSVLPTQNWLRLEVIIFSINCISDSIVLSDENTQALSALIGSSLFNDISSNDVEVPNKLKRAAMTLVDRYSSFIKKNPQFLPPVLTFLFTILASTPADRVKLADASARTLEQLCSSCRKSLTPHLGELLQQCPQALSGPSANSYQKEKIMAALASIIQALPTEEAKAAPLESLIGVIENDLNTAITTLNAGNLEDSEMLGTSALQCLASIGKGIQALTNDVIDVDSDDEEANDDPAATSNFWTSSAGVEIQNRIVQCINIVEFLHNPGDAMDAACAILRAGLKETKPGPFVFPPQATVTFISKAQISTPRIEAIIGTACSFVSNCSRKSAPHMFDEMSAVYQRVALVMQQLGDPANDPQLAQLCIDFLQRLLVSYIDVLLSPSDDEIAAVLQFVINCMVGNAPMLKRNACNFFETLLGLANPRTANSLPPCRVPPLSVLSAFAGPLSQALIFNIGGLAQRSEIESLCKPLRALVFSQPGLAKQHLEASLLDPGFPSTNVGEKEKRVFAAKVLGLRGGRQTVVVVKEFWALCKGTVTSFE